MQEQDRITITAIPEFTAINFSDNSILDYSYILIEA